MTRYLLISLLLLFAINSHAESFVYFQNNSSLDFTATSVQTGSHTMESDEWWGMNNQTITPWQLNTNVLWTNRNVGINSGVDFFLTTTLKSGVDSINIKLQLNGNFIGSDIWHAADGPGFSHPWRDDRSFYEETFTLNGKLVTLKYKAYAAGTYDDFLFVLEEHEPFPAPTTELANPDILNILTYNIYMLSPPISLTNQSTRAAYIHQHVQGYDAIIVNEAFDNGARDILTANLAAEYPYATVVVDDGSALEDGGVLIYSRWPITYSAQMSYADCDGSDCLAPKGVMYAKIDKLGRPYHIFGTHTQAWPDATSVAVRQLQLAEMKAFVDAQNIPTDEAVLIGGDLNVDKIANNFDEYNAMFPILNAEIPDYLGHPFTYDYLVSSYAGSPSQEYLDYVLYEKAHLVPTIQTNEVLILRSIADAMWDIFDLSDHLAVRGRFVFPIPPTCAPSLVLSATHTDGVEVFQAAVDISSTESVSGTSNITYQAATCVELQAGFSVELGAEFEVKMEGCGN